MSRSYREPWTTQGYGGEARKFFKNYANRKVRRFKGEMQNGKWYRKIFDSWSICDWKWMYDPNPWVCWYGEDAPYWSYSSTAERPWRVFRK